ncbi:MAG: toxin-antitoxin system YwqK family antitoxin [Flavobacteriales bacterium]
MKYLSSFFVALILPLAAYSQSAEFNQWQSSYSDYKQNFEKNLDEPLHQNLKAIPDKYFTSDVIPEWIFEINENEDGVLYSIGISDPFTDSETAYQQALNRAIFTLSLQMKTMVNGMNELYSKIEENGKSSGNVFTEYYQLLSSEQIDFNYLTLIEKKYLKTGECIVKFKYKTNASREKNFNTFVTLEYYRQEKSLDMGYETIEKLAYSGNSMSDSSFSNSCSYTLKKFNNKEDVLSECPVNTQYTVGAFTYQSGSSTLISANGLWSLFIYKFINKIISSSQVSSSIVKNVQDNYLTLNNKLTREIVINQGNFPIASTDSALNITFINEASSNLIHDIKEGCITTWHPNGVKKSEEYYSNDMMDGTQREWTSNDKLISEINYNHGVLDGSFQLWYDNMQLKEFRMYKSGVMVEKHSIWTENGQLLLQEEFDEQGNPVGTYLEYFPNGQLRVKGKFKNGKKEGTFMFYEESGKKFKKEVYKKGTLKKRKEYMRDL